MIIHIYKNRHGKFYIIAFPAVRILNEKKWEVIMKKTIIIIAIFLSLLSFFYGYLFLKERENENLINSMKNAFSENYSGDLDYVDLANLTSFKWDRLYIFQPYTTKEKMRSVLGISSAWLINTEIASSDSYTLLVFIRKGFVVMSLDFYRGDGDFSYLDTGVGYSPNNSKFIIDQGGRIYLFE